MNTTPVILRSNAELVATRAPGVASGELGRRQTQFALLLADHGAKAAGEEESTRVARDLVAVALVQPLLKQWRESDQTPPPFGPGQAAKQFLSMQDANLSQELTRASRFPLVDRLARDLRRGTPTQETNA